MLVSSGAITINLQSPIDGLSTVDNMPDLENSQLMVEIRVLISYLKLLRRGLSTRPSTCS
jgi:hypothetical protein